MNNFNRITSALVCCVVCVASGCQLQRTLQRFTSSSKPEDPSYLLDPATEARQLAAMSSQTRDDLNAFTDYSNSNQQVVSNAATSGTAAAYLAERNTPAASPSAASLLPQQFAPPVQSAQAQISTGSEASLSSSYSGQSRYAVAPASQQPLSAMQQNAMPASAAEAQEPSQPPAAELNVRGVTPGAGPVRIAVFDSAAAFPNRNAARQKFSLDSSAQQIKAPLVASSATVAVAAFQDLNNDGQLNRSAFGIPTEPYGFSGVASRSLGPPSFSEAAVKPNGAVEVLLTK